MNVIRPRPLVAIVLAVLALLLAPLTSASADPGTPTQETGSLTVHGFVSPGGAGDGSSLPRGAEPIAGLVFTVTRINGVDLTTSEGWELARWYADGHIAEAAQNAGATVTLPPTGADGTATAPNLALGLYLVHETESSTALRGAGALPSADFLVTVPMVDQSDPDSWVYAVEVYPKRDMLEITKAVSDLEPGGAQAVKPGDVMTYTLTASIPSAGAAGFGGRCERDGRVDAGEGLSPDGFMQSGFCAPGATYVGTAAGASYRIVDDLSTQPVTGTTQKLSDFVELSGPGWTGSTVVEMSDGTALAQCGAGVGCDYRMSRTASALTVELTDAGIIRLAEAYDLDPGLQLTVAFQARIRMGTSGQLAPVEQATRDGAVLQLPNTAELRLTGGISGDGLVLSSNRVVSRYGALTIHKVDGNGRGLDGAVFVVYLSLDDATARRNPIATSAPTDADGMTRVAGLHVTGFANDDVSDESYWLVETAAPTGYFAISQPVRVQISADGRTRNADATGGVPIRNERNILLPRTGSDVMAMVAVGLGLVIFGLVILRGARRRREPEEARG